MNKLKKYWVIIITTTVLQQFISCSESPKRPVDFVNPFICTEGDHGHWHPSALVPFGLVKLGPDTYPSSLTGDGDYAHSGYNYADTIIRGFSHFHRGSSGGVRIVDRAGMFSVMPFSEFPSDSFFVNPVVAIDKNSEKAVPGFYSVLLSPENILSELTASVHTGMHRYTFPPGKYAHLYINEGNKNGGGIECKVINDKTIEGKLNSFGGAWFIMKFNVPLQSTQAWDGIKLLEAKHVENYTDGGFVCNFDDLKGKPLELKVGVSLTSIEAARKNLELECEGWDFDKLKRKASDSWNDKLSLVNVEGDEEYKTIFYTALYHTCFLPVIQSDVEKTYKGLDKNIHLAKGYTHYNGYAFWDSFRTKYPLYSLCFPGVYRDIVSSLRDVYDQADNWGPYPDCYHEPHGQGLEAYGKNGFQVFSTCRHEHMLMVVTDAYYKNLFHDDVTIHELYPFLKNEVMLQMPEKYDSIGYIPARPDQTGEYCWDNWCVAQIAKDLGYDKYYDYLMKRSRYWINTWDPSIKFFRARAEDGEWLDFPEDPTINREKYTYEGTKWQWRWNVLHDVPAMIEVFGGKENFVKELEYFFENNLYTAGNQIDLQVPFLFNPAGTPWHSQKWVHQILTEPMIQLYGTHDFFSEPILDRIYKATPDGYLEEMDDDYGCMAAWYAMSAMGLYQICPGKPVYQITSPIFDLVTIKLDPEIYPGKSFTVQSNNLSKKNYYIQSATLNGKPLNRSRITHKEIIGGGKLVFEMGPEPNKQWGVE